MCFIYSSGFTAVTQSSMARTAYRQMLLTSPLLNFKGQLTACPECLLWILWAQFNHRERKPLLEKQSCKRGRQIAPLLPSWWVDYGIEMLQGGSRLPIPFTSLSLVSPTCTTCSIHHFLEASKPRQRISLIGLFDSCHKSQQPQELRVFLHPALSAVHCSAKRQLKLNKPKVWLQHQLLRCWEWWSSEKISSTSSGYHPFPSLPCNCLSLPTLASTAVK